MTTMFHGEIGSLFVKSGRNDNGDEIGLVLGERLRRSGVELIVAKPQLSLGLAEHIPVDANGGDGLYQTKVSEWWQHCGTPMLPLSAHADLDILKTLVHCGKSLGIGRLGTGWPLALSALRCRCPTRPPAGVASSK